MTTADRPHEHHRETCRRYLSSLGDYVEGVLSADLCDELEAHMATCENCRVVVNTLAKTITLYRQMPSPELPSAVKERLFAVLDLKPYFDAGENTSGSAE
jgi:anti-sigma factor RsiW